MSHTFHIPVLGLGFSIDTPLKVAKYGISSVVSIVDDQMIERMREYHVKQNGLVYLPILASEDDFRAKRITAYLNLLDDLVKEQIENLKAQDFSEGSEICRYFELLPDHLPQKQLYITMLQEPDGQLRGYLQQRLRSFVTPGAIDVNIMSKVDKINYAKNGQALGDKFSDALASLRGFANSNLSSSIILSAGMNPRLYSYLEEFDCFFPRNGQSPEKKIILKVSDYRSAFIQAKFLAKKGLWIHEFRIESGLNCGGHAFATEGFLLGPILEEFKEKRQQMTEELFQSYQSVLASKGISDVQKPITRITVQGGIGTAEENEFLQNHYQLDGTGWGSPFLLVPEATNVDESTLNLLATAENDDFYVSGASPLGVPFNNFRKSTAEQQRLERIEKGRPGSPCTKKYLVSNTEFTNEPICTASREYQNLKLKELDQQALPQTEYEKAYASITEKLCLCQGLVASAYIKKGMLKPRENKAVAICPGPNTAYFSGVYTLEEMVKHIYGKLNLLKSVTRPHVFVNELKLYVEYLKKDVEMSVKPVADKKAKQLNNFKEQLLLGVDYYLNLLPNVSACADQVSGEIKKLQQSIAEINVLVSDLNHISR